MIKVGQKYIFNGSAGDPMNGEIVTVLPPEPFTEGMSEIAGEGVFVVMFDKDSSETAAFESELSEIG